MASILKGFLLAAFAAIVAEAGPHSFQHVIVIVQENRTPDNLFQALCAPLSGSPAGCSTRPTGSEYNIQTSNWLNKASTTGITQPTGLALASKYDMSHTHPAFVANVRCRSEDRSLQNGRRRKRRLHAEMSKGHCLQFRK